MPYLLLALAVLFWSGNFVISRGMHAAIPPFTLAYWRWLTALVVLLPLAAKYLGREQATVRRHLVYIGMQGVVGVAGFNTFIYLAMQTTTAINAALVNSSMPVLIAICSWILYRETMTVRQGLGVLISLTGVLRIISGGELAQMLAMDFNRGDLLVLVASALWAIYSANLKRYPQELHPLVYLTATVFVGVVVLTPLYLYERGSGLGMELSFASVATIVYVALFASVFAYLFWNRAVREVGANRAGPFIYLMPVFSTILAVLFLGERIEGFHLQGILMISFGIFLTTFRVRARRVVN
ncbi:MAG: DMT family transporter [Desulfopila sp.]